MINGYASGSSRVDRGSDWSNGSQYARVAVRFSNSPDYRNYSLGVRLVRRCA